MTDENNDVEFELEDSPESNTHEKLIAKVAKLKAELEKTKAERQEYLDGWQRMRADVANIKREQAAAAGLMESAIKEQVTTDIIPILDSFDMAMQGETWGSVDPAWRKGVEHIRTQCETALSRHGVTSFGEVGEQFDPTIHESLQEIESDLPPHSIVRISRRGYRSGARLIRPAQVIIAK